MKKYLLVLNGLIQFTVIMLTLYEKWTDFVFSV